MEKIEHVHSFSNDRIESNRNCDRRLNYVINYIMPTNDFSNIYGAQQVIFYNTLH